MLAAHDRALTDSECQTKIRSLQACHTGQQLLSLCACRLRCLYVLMLRPQAETGASPLSQPEHTSTQPAALEKRSSSSQLTSMPLLLLPQAG